MKWRVILHYDNVTKFPQISLYMQYKISMIISIIFGGSFYFKIKLEKQRFRNR